MPNLSVCEGTFPDHEHKSAFNAHCLLRDQIGTPQWYRLSLGKINEPFG